MFGLFRYFSLASALILCAAVGGLVVLYRQTAESELTYLTETQNAVLAHSLVNAVWPRFAEYVESASGIDPATLAARPEPAEIHRALARVTDGLPVLKVKTYNLEGTTIYSTDPAEIGESHADNTSFMRTAAGGRPASELMHKERIAAFGGLRENLDVVETYIPVTNGAGHVRGVFELYTDVSSQMAKIRGTTHSLLAGLVAAFGLLYCGLLLIVRRAERIIRAQYTELEAEVDRRKRVEGELRTARDGALEASRAKSAFLANMNHELRTPLNAVLGFSEVIAEEVFGPVRPHRYREYAADIRRAGRHLLWMVDNVLDLAKIEAGKMETVERRFDVSAVVEDVCAALKPVIGQNGNRFELRCAKEAGRMTTDEGKLRSILTNVLGNAGKFTEGGVVGLRVAREGDWLSFRVTDSGIGFDVEMAGDLFGEFTQADAAAAARGVGGSGLGLAICRRFCDMLGGDIKIASRPGDGTCVTVRLPDRAPETLDLDIAV